VILLLLFYRIRYAIIGAASFISTGVFVQILKRSFSFPRPSEAITHFDQLQQIPWLDLAGANSFPSGHSAVLFAMCCFLSLIFNNRKWGILLVLIAIFGSLTRVYLAQHFLVDILFGSMIGVTFTALLYRYLTRSQRLSQYSWIDQSVSYFWK
jgi:membrane-associated phospholipid phosphatase